LKSFKQHLSILEASTQNPSNRAMLIKGHMPPKT
jgi:hypothetical protein